MRLYIAGYIGLACGDVRVIDGLYMCHLVPFTSFLSDNTIHFF